VELHRDMGEYRIAYLGMGIMGSAMAANLAKSGCQVAVWNRTLGRLGLKIAQDSGATAHSTIADAVQGRKFIFTCISDVEDVREVLTGPGGVAAHADPDSLIIDTSTIGPQAAIDLAAKLEKSGLRFMDAPVTGGDIGARNGTLVIMVGGRDKDFEEAKPLFGPISKSATLCGPVGSGQALKLCNQIFCAVNMVGLCEAYCLAKTFDLNLELLPGVLSGGAGGSWALQNLGPRIAAGDFSPGFMLKDMLKDLRLVMENSDNADKLAGTMIANNNFRKAQSLSSPDRGTQSMILAYE
jgi:3-hydroxyisobutyrate dehydrogenase